MSGVADGREPREFELKLEFDPADLAALEAHPLLAGIEPSRRTLLSVYYDSQSRALHAAGLALRVRDTGSGYVQTIKGDGPAELFDRPEWEQSIRGPDPDMRAMAGTPVGTVLQGDNLAPLFQTRIERGAYQLNAGDSAVEVAIDCGDVAAGDSSTLVHEVELELKQGEPRELFVLARKLAASVRLRLAVKTKAERGYELVVGTGAEAEKAAKLALDGGLPCCQAFRVIAHSCLRQIVVNASGVCARDAESLHQMRIGLRRMRAAIAAFSKMVDDEAMDGVKSDLKWITSELGAARDLDVLRSDVLKPLSSTQGNEARFAAARRAVAEAHAEAYDSAVRAVQSERFGTALLDLAEWIEVGAWTRVPSFREHRETKLAEHAAQLLKRGRKRMRKRGADLRKLSPKERHKLRIKAKNLRYAVEFFAGVFPGEENAQRREAALSALKDLQDYLGALNDLAQREALAAKGREFGDEARDWLAPKDVDIDKLLDKAQAAQANFADVKSFWK
jgi:triphosphatase